MAAEAEPRATRKRDAYTANPEKETGRKRETSESKPIFNEVISFVGNNVMKIGSDFEIVSGYF